MRHERCTDAGMHPAVIGFAVGALAWTSATLARADEFERPPEDGSAKKTEPTTSIFLSAPVSFGVVGGFEGQVLTNGAARTTGAALHVGVQPAIGPRLALALGWRYLYSEISYEDLLLLPRSTGGNFQRGTALVGVALPLAPVVFPFLAAGPQIWSFGVPVSGGASSWGTGPRGALAVDGGLRFTPWRRRARPRHSALDVGLIFHGGGQVAGGSAWSASVTLALGSWFDP